MVTQQQLVTLVIAIAAVRLCYGIEVSRVSIPREVQFGDNVTLSCSVTAGQSGLYSLSWWKDGEQFYRAAHTHQPNLHIFPLDSLPNVKTGAGGLGSVVLVNVNVRATGNYTCEAVADFPSFAHHSQSRLFTVLAKPATRPILSGYKNWYHPGELLSVNCTLLRAHPKPKIVWFFNDRQVSGGHHQTEELADAEGGTITITKQLNIRLTEHQLNSGKVNLTCGARVGRHYWTTNTIAFGNARLRKAVSSIPAKSFQIEEHQISVINQKSKDRGEVVSAIQQFDFVDSDTTPSEVPDIYQLYDEYQISVKLPSEIISNRTTSQQQNFLPQLLLLFILIFVLLEH